MRPDHGVSAKDSPETDVGSVASNRAKGHAQAFSEHAHSRLMWLRWQGKSLG